MFNSQIKTFVVHAHKDGDNIAVVSAKTISEAMQRGKALLHAPIIKVYRDESRISERV